MVHFLMLEKKALILTLFLGVTFELLNSLYWVLGSLTKQMSKLGPNCVVGSFETKNYVFFRHSSMAVLLALRSLLIWKAKWAFVQQQIFFSYGYEKKKYGVIKDILPN